MERIAVKSSNIKSIGYEPGNKQLDVEFSNGTLYSYVGVPRKAYEEMSKAESVGRYFHAKIKPFYKHEKQEEKTDDEKI